MKVAFDSNYRPLNWGGDALRARALHTEALKHVDIALPSFGDEARLWGDKSPEDTVRRLTECGIREIAVKNEGNDALVAFEGENSWIPVPRKIQPIDTTGAGDSFNAGYLASRLSGETAKTAVARAHALAGKAIQHRGAIIPRV